MTTTTTALRPRNLATLAPAGLLAICLAWSYWPTLMELAHTWSSNPQYSHGFLVPVFVGFLLYQRRDKLDVTALAPSLWGFGVLALALGFRLFGAYKYYVSVEPYSIVPVVAGLVLLMGGWAAMRWAWPGVLFLTFMVPLPYFAAVAMSGPLQRFATLTSTFFMQTLGLPALAEGNVILLNDQVLGIVEACSGLRMLVVFFALSTAVVLMSQRPWVEQMIIVLSAIPIALASNIIRIVSTGILYEMGWGETANAFFHDASGWLMMPMGLGMLWVELKIMNALIIEGPRPVPMRRPAAARRPQQAQAARPASPRPRRQAQPRQTPAARQETPVEAPTPVK